MILSWLITFVLYDIALLSFTLVLVAIGKATVNVASLLTVESVAGNCGKLGSSLQKVCAVIYNYKETSV